MGRSEESKEYALSRSQNWGTLTYPTQEYYYKYLKDNNLCDHFRESDHCPIDFNGNELYNGAEGWGEFDEKSFQVIYNSQVPFLCSPMHYLDVNFEKDSTPFKKPHFHWIFVFDSVKSSKQFVEYLDFLKGFHAVGYKKLDSRKGAAHYLCHIDSDTKARYDPSLVIAFGLDYFDIITSSSDDDNEVCLMMDYIMQNHIFTFRKFLMICKTDFPTWFTILTRSRGYIIDKFIKSYCWELENFDRLDNMEKLATEFDNRYMEK